MNPWEEEDSIFLAKWLNNELTEAEKTEFENSEEGRTFLGLIEATDRLELSPFDVNKAYNELKSSQAPKARADKTIFMRPWVRMAIAASLVAILVVSYLLTKPKYTVITTGIGQSEVVVLPGGSVITLNANSQIKYEEASWSKQRKVLLEGEAFFDVVKGNEFVVKTDEGNIRVLGTSFNIRARDDDLDVICYTGKVNVFNKTANTDLTPGKSVRIENLNIVREWTQNLTGQPKWINGITELDEVTPDIVLQELKHQFGITINNGVKLKNEKYRLSFSNTNMGESVRLVMSVMGLQYTFDATQKILVIEGEK